MRANFLVHLDETSVVVYHGTTVSASGQVQAKRELQWFRVVARSEVNGTFQLVIFILLFYYLFKLRFILVTVSAIATHNLNHYATCYVQLLFTVQLVGT